MTMFENLAKLIKSAESKFLQPALTNSVSQFVLIYLFIFMTSFQSQQLNNTQFSEVLKRPYMYFLILFGVNYSMSKNLLVSFVLAVIMTILFALLKIIEFMSPNLELIKNTPDILPKFYNVTVSDIKNYYNNDEVSMRKSLNQLNIPDHYLLNNNTAPIIATYMYFAGHDISK